MSSKNETKESTEQSKGKLCSINRRMIPSKLVYLLSLGGAGSYVPYLNIFFKSIGLTTSQAGFISGIRFISAPVSTLLWSGLTDSWGHRKVIFLVLCIGSSLPIFCLPWVARELNHISYNISTTDVYTNRSRLNGTLYVNQFAATPCDRLFYVILSMMIFAGFFSVPLAGFIDSVVINIIKSGKQKTCFGAQRVVGSISFGLANFLAGLAADNYHHPTLSKYTAIFFISLPQMLLLIPSGCFLVAQAKWKERKQKDNNRDFVLKQMSTFISKMDSILFMITVFISGIAYNMFYGFVFLLMRDEMKSSEQMMTLVIVMTSVAEIVMFPITSKLIRLLGGTTSTIILCMLSYLVRFVSISFVINTWVMIPIQLLHGVSFSLNWAAQLEHTHNNTPKEIGGTVLSILTSVHFAFGALVANLVGGELYDILGGRLLFRGIGIICGIWSGFMLIYLLIKKHSNSLKIGDIKMKDGSSF